MRLAPDQLADALRQSLLPIYLVAGEEAQLVDECLDQLRQAAREQGFVERQVLDVERGFDWSLLSGAMQAMSLFASRKLVEVRMPGGAPGKEGGRLLTELAQAPSPDVLLLVICGELDYRQQQSAWYGALESAGAAVYARAISEAQWPRWLQQRLMAQGLEVDQDALDLLAQRTAGNAMAATQDIAKLKLLFAGEAIGVEQMRASVADSARFDVFDMTDKMLQGDTVGALRCLQVIRAEGVEPVELLGAISWTLRQLAKALDAFARSGDPQSACSAARIPRFRNRTFSSALPRMRSTQAYGWLRQCAQIDRLSKSTGGKEQAWEELLTLTAAVAGHRVLRPTTTSIAR